MADARSPLAHSTMQMRWPTSCLTHYRRSSALCASVAACMAHGAVAAGPSLVPGLYQVEVRVDLPNVPNATASVVLTRCLSRTELESGQAFAVLSDNPLRTCDLLDYAVTGDIATYRIVCPGANRGSAVAVFETRATAYRGSIKMNMGGKNMTMSETQAGKRVGDCD